jgi:hypothetical protein
MVKGEGKSGKGESVMGGMGESGQGDVGKRVNGKAGVLRVKA